MNTATEKKPVVTLDKKANDSTSSLGDSASPAVNVTLGNKAVETATQKFREGLNAIDAQRAQLVKNAIDNVKPGRTFDSSVVRQINKLETKRNRLIVGHFASLLKHNPDAVHAIVHQIIEL
jgi:hypothetical protein